MGRNSGAKSNSAAATLSRALERVAMGDGVARTSAFPDGVWERGEILLSRRTLEENSAKVAEFWHPRRGAGAFGKVSGGVGPPKTEAGLDHRLMDWQASSLPKSEALTCTEVLAELRFRADQGFLRTAASRLMGPPPAAKR